MGMGMGSGGMAAGKQVYFDPQQNQYYTESYRGINAPGFNDPSKLYRTYIGESLGGQKSPINDLVAQAMAAKANPVSLAQLFPSMNAPTMGTPMTNYGGLLGQASPFGQGQFGAGRFLGGNAMGNTGMTSNAMNTM